MTVLRTSGNRGNDLEPGPVERTTTKVEYFTGREPSPLCKLFEWAMERMSEEEG